MTRETVRAEDMTLLLLLIMNHVMDVKTTKDATLSPSVPTELSTCASHPCEFNTECCNRATESSNTFCSKSVTGNDQKSNDCSGKPQNGGTSKACDSAETEAIHNIINTTKQSMNCNFMDLAIKVVNMNSVPTHGHVQITAPKVSNKTQSVQTWIPVEAFQNVSDDKQKVGIVTYNSIQQFNTKNVSIMSDVIRIEVFGRDIVNLTNPLIIHFPVNNYTNLSSNSYIYSCQYYDEKGNNTWKDNGCNTTQISDDVVECSCDHMTAFAVLLVELENFDGKHWEILSYISYVGCGLSAVFSASSVLLFIFNSSCI